jgi:hypothetical protein
MHFLSWQEGKCPENVLGRYFNMDNDGPLGPLLALEDDKEGLSQQNVSASLEKSCC